MAAEPYKVIPQSAAALNLIEPNTLPLRVMHARLLKNINLEHLPDESGEYLLRMVQPE